MNPVELLVHTQAYMDICNARYDCWLINMQMLCMEIHVIHHPVEINTCLLCLSSVCFVYVQLPVEN